MKLKSRRQWNPWNQQNPKSRTPNSMKTLIFPRSHFFRAILEPTRSCSEITVIICPRAATRDSTMSAINSKVRWSILFKYSVSSKERKVPLKNNNTKLSTTPMMKLQNERYQRLTNRIKTKNRENVEILDPESHPQSITKDLKQKMIENSEM